MKKRIFILLLAITSATIVQSQDKLFTIDEVVMKQRTSLAPERLAQLMWLPKGGKFSYVGKRNEKDVLIIRTMPELKSDTVLTAEELYNSLYSNNPNEKKFEKFPAISWLTNSSLKYFYGQSFYLYDFETKRTKLLVKLPKNAENIDYESNTNRVAYTIENNIYASDIASADYIDNLPSASGDMALNKSDMISIDGSYGIVYGQAVHRNEFGINKGTFWSPNGNRLAYYRMQENLVTDYPVMDLSTVPAKNKNIKYPMAGAASHTIKVFIKDFKRNRNIEVQTAEPAEQYLTNIAWSPDEEFLYIAVVNREQNEMKLNLYDGNTGTFIKTLFTEKNEKYVEPEKSVVFVKGDKRKFIWMSERDGFNQLYLYSVSGELIKQLSSAKQHISDLLGFDEKGNAAFYSAYSEDGMNKYTYSLDLKTGKTTKLTSIDGIHNSMLSPDGNYIIDQFSNINSPRRVVIIDNKAREYGSVLNALNPIYDYQKTEIKLGKLIASDKKTELNYRMILPSNFDATKKYPVLVYVYGGPHAQMITNSWLAASDMWFLYMAQQGYVVFTLDNRGSVNRGFDFESATFRHFGNVEMEDQLLGVDFLKQQKFVDEKRLGVYGWSFGGFMSTSFMTRKPDVFKVGVAGGPVIDWRLYEIMYTERYMDTPKENPEGYKESDLHNYVKNLKGKLLLIHGTNDETVVWQHSLSYIKKCVDEGVLVDYFVYPGHAHNVLGPNRVHLMKKITQYFKENL